MNRANSGDLVGTELGNFVLEHVVDLDLEVQGCRKAISLISGILDN